MKALIIGLGSIGSRHLNNLYILGIKQIIVLRKRNLKPLTKLPNDIKFYFNLDKALLEKPDIVVISNPTSMHLEILIKALKSGCHIYVEKPVSHDLRDIETLLYQYKLTNSIVQVGCQLRQHPHIIKIKEYLHSGKIGNIHSVVCDVGEYLPDWHPWEDYRISYASRNDQGGGVILTMIHEIDYLYWLFGPVSVLHAIGGKRTPLDLDVEDTALITMKNNENVPIQLRMDYWRRPPVRTLNIIGDNFEIFWDYHLRKLEFFSKGKKIEEDILSKKWDRNELFLNMMKNFLNSINGKEIVCSSLEDGIEVLKIASDAKDKIDLNNKKLMK